MKKVLFVSLIALSMTALAVQSEEADGKAIFEAKCTMCHGKDGKAATKMGEKLKIRDLSDAKVQAELKDEAIVKAIKEGIKKDDTVVMKPYADKLSEAEIKAAADYVRTLKAK